MAERKYRAIAEELAGGIRRGEYPAGTRLPPLNVLAERYGVARGTARAAVEVLVGDGLAIIRHGHGTVVCADAFAPVQDRADASPADGTATVLAGWAQATGDIALRLGQKAGALSAHRIHHRRRRGRLVGIDEHWIPDHVVDRVQRVTDLDLADQSVTPQPDLAALLRRAGIGLTVAALDVYARTATAREVALMGLDDGAPVSTARLVTHDASGSPVEVRMTVCVEPISVITLAGAERPG